MSVSPDTVLRRVRSSPAPDLPAPRVVGIDDWAFRRGQRYGTILYDLERHRPVALLPERTAEAVADWLRQHPEVEVVGRDRGDVYIKGAAAGAPLAVQVADRFHLVRNLRQALARLLDRHSGQVLATVRAINQRRESAREAPQPCGKAELNASERVTSAKRRSQQRRAQRLERYQAVIELWRQSVSQREIARRLDLDRGTVLRYVRAGQFPERASRTYRRGADAFGEFLQRRWSEGCRNARVLVRELQEQGCKISYHAVRRYVAQWRGGRADCVSAGTSVRALSSQRLVTWLLKPETRRTDEEQEFVNAFVEQSPLLNSAAAACREFELLLRSRQSQLLDQWLVKTTELKSAPELRRFALGLRDDLPAVEAAFSMPWSNGPVEGAINRLKLIKRQMYGRAKFDLLQRRVLFAG